MRINRAIFLKAVLPPVICGLFALAGILLTGVFNKEEGKLASREITETRNQDGSVTKRSMEVFK